MTPHRVRRGLTALAATLLAFAPLSPALASVPAGGEDPNLDQSLDNLEVVHGKRVLESGHIDMGPKYDGNDWRLLIHDDVAKADANATSVWRHPADTVFHVLDQAKLKVPDDPAYEFLGVEPGSAVWVVPQTQNPDVVWLGWNTQDPEVMRTIDRGVTLSLDGVQGPGEVTTYLQSGSFGEPQVLFDSRKSASQPAWVDVNTHTHANWVFTKPGVYLLAMTVQADLVDGSHVSDTQYLRFAVSSGASTDEALAASWEGSAPATPSKETGQASVPSADGMWDDPLVLALIGLIALVVVALVAGFTIAVVRGNRTRRRILAAHLNNSSPNSSHSTGGTQS